MAVLLPIHIVAGGLALLSGAVALSVAKGGGVHRASGKWAMPSLDLAVIHELVLRHARATWVLAGINYLHEFRMAVSLMRRLATVHVETSCIMGFAGIAKLVFDCGAERILFGSGAPIHHGGAGVEKILRADIGDSAREAILGGNAQRLLGLNE